MIAATSGPCGPSARCGSSLSTTNHADAPRLFGSEYGSGVTTFRLGTGVSASSWQGHCSPAQSVGTVETDRYPAALRRSR